MFIPFVMVFMFCGWKKMWEVWPALMVASLCFTIPAYLISNYSNPYIVDVVAGATALAGMVLFLRVWQPKTIMTDPSLKFADDSHSDVKPPEQLKVAPHVGQCGAGANVGPRDRLQIARNGANALPALLHVREQLEGNTPMKRNTFRFVCVLRIGSPRSGFCGSLRFPQSQ